MSISRARGIFTPVGASPLASRKASNFSFAWEICTSNDAIRSAIRPSGSFALGLILLASSNARRALSRRSTDRDQALLQRLDSSGCAQRLRRGSRQTVSHSVQRANNVGPILLECRTFPVILDEVFETGEGFHGRNIRISSPIQLIQQDVLTEPVTVPIVPLQAIELLRRLRKLPVRIQIFCGLKQVLFCLAQGADQTKTVTSVLSRATERLMPTVNQSERRRLAPAVGRETGVGSEAAAGESVADPSVAPTTGAGHASGDSFGGAEWSDTGGIAPVGTVESPKPGALERGLGRSAFAGSAIPAGVLESGPRRHGRRLILPADAVRRVVLRLAVLAVDLNFEYLSTDRVRAANLLAD